MRASDRTPIALIVDDSAPGVHVYQCHCRDVHHRTHTSDGRPLLEFIPNSLLEQFGDVVERRGLAGKFSIVPNPGGRGNIPDEIDGVPPEQARAWLDIARERLGPHFDFCPEMITHNLTLDLATGTFLPLSEHDWSQTQNRSTLTPYIAHALGILKRAGIDATGVTSPWHFAADVVEEYEASIAAAQEQVYGRKYSWYFCHTRVLEEGARAWVALDDGDTVLVSVPGTTHDAFWQTIDTPRDDDAFVSEVAGQLLTQDGRDGEIRQMLDGGGWPILVTHWQSMFSNGLGTGLRALDELGRRVQEHLGDEVVWCSFADLCERLTGRPMESPARARPSRSAGGR
jgi:hypothetical protein